MPAIPVKIIFNPLVCTGPVNCNVGKDVERGERVGTGESVILLVPVGVDVAISCAVGKPVDETVGVDVAICDVGEPVDETVGVDVPISCAVGALVGFIVVGVVVTGELIGVLVVGVIVGPIVGGIVGASDGA
jgi:hypothetical protein